MKQFDFWNGATEPVGKAKKEKNRVYQRHWRGNNWDKHYGYTRSWKKRNEGKCAKQRLKAQRLRLYGLSYERWSKMFEVQGAACAICGSKDFGKTGPHTDHCHKTGHVRGILCHFCNHMLGNAHDSSRILRAAAKYLEREVIFNGEV